MLLSLGKGLAWSQDNLVTNNRLNSEKLFRSRTVYPQKEGNEQFESVDIKHSLSLYPQAYILSVPLLHILDQMWEPSYFRELNIFECFISQYQSSAGISFSLYMVCSYTHVQDLLDIFSVLGYLGQGAIGI